MKNIEIMHKLFGYSEPPDFTCSTCCHFMTYTANRTFFKCNCYGNTRSSASDWRKSYPACGLWNETYVGNDVITFAHQFRKKKDDVQIEGQMELEL